MPAEAKLPNWIQRNRRHLAGGLAVAFALAVWEVEARWLASHNEFGGELLPTFEHVVSTSVPEMALFGSESAHPSFLGALEVIVEHSQYTVLRLVVGTFLGVVIGIGLGLAISSNRILRGVIEPPILVLRNIPLLTLIPLFVLWFGSSETGKYVYVSFAVAVMLVINTVQANANVKPIFLEYARTLGAGKVAAYRTVIIPAILPELLAGVKVALGVSWAIVLAAEFLAAEKGLGKLLILSQTFFDVGRMLVIVLVFIIYSLILNVAFDSVSRRVTRWTPRAM